MTVCLLCFAGVAIDQSAAPALEKPSSADETLLFWDDFERGDKGVLYRRLYDSPSEARQCLAEFRQRYNTRRPHWALIPEEGGDPLTLEDVYAQGQSVRLPAWQPWAKQAKAQLD